MGISLQSSERTHTAATIDTVSELRGDGLIRRDTLSIDLTSGRNDLLVFVKDHCLSGLALMCGTCRIVMETVVRTEPGLRRAQGSEGGLTVATAIAPPTSSDVCPIQSHFLLSVTV